jgi:REP element-mobilizing transposase RayT
MKEWQSLAHTKRECKYHVATVPKYRKEGTVWEIAKEDRRNPVGAIPA